MGGGGRTEYGKGGVTWGGRGGERDVREKDGGRDGGRDGGKEGEGGREGGRGHHGQQEQGGVVGIWDSCSTIDWTASSYRHVLKVLGRVRRGKARKQSCRGCSCSAPPITGSVSVSDGW